MNRVFGRIARRIIAADCINLLVTSYSGSLFSETADYRSVDRITSFERPLKLKLSSDRFPSNHSESDDAEILAYGHDRDRKTRKLIQNIWEKPQLLDRNHIAKSFDWKPDNSYVLRGIKGTL
jgi:hypothetical protein